MKLSNINEVNDFLAAVDRCKGDVWLEDAKGDRLSLKSMFSRYIAMGNLLQDKGEELELFCSQPRIWPSSLACSLRIRKLSKEGSLWNF